ncbi:MAG: hypothetical protein IT454_11905 [Planctomycetes bacterium]|nr:hypothetical protein [Planctomycetota bacterium]
MKHVLNSFVFLGCAALPAGAQVVVGALDPSGGGLARIWHIDVASGDRTELLQAQVAALAVDDSGGRLFFCGFDNRLFQWNYASSSAPVQICTMHTASGGLPVIGGMAYANGVLYVTGNSSAVTVSRVDLTSGLMTQTAAPLWVSGDSLAADPATGKLYSYVEVPLSGHAPGLYELDPTNMANPLQVAPMAQVYDVDGLAVGGGRAYFIEDSYFDFPIFDFATNAYLPNRLTSPFGNEFLMAGGEFAPSLPQPGGPRFYCHRKASSQFCESVTLTSGTPSISAPTPFLLTAYLLAPRRAALWNYSLAGRANIPFAGGTLCIAAPVRRAQGVRTHGTTDCTGRVDYDFGAFLRSGADPALAVGARVDAQLFVRDPGFSQPDNLALSDAIEFTILP